MASDRPMIDRQLGQISSHVTWSSEVALSLINGVTGAQRPLRSPLWNVTISVAILLFCFGFFTLSCGWWEKTPSRCDGNRRSLAHASKRCKKKKKKNAVCFTKAGLRRESAACVTAFQGNRRTNTNANGKMCIETEQLFHKAVKMPPPPPPPTP